MNTEQMNEAEENVSIDLEESGSVEVEQTSEPEQLSERFSRQTFRPATWGLGRREP